MTKTATSPAAADGSKAATVDGQPAQPAPPATVTDIATARKAPRQLEAVRFKGAEYVRVIHHAAPFDNTIPEDLLVPDYWAHVADRMKQYDRVEALANDGTWWAEYIVVACGRAYAQLRLLRKASLDPVTLNKELSQALRAYEVCHRGPHSQWSVIRLSDNQVVHEGSQTESGANTWLTNHLKAMGR